MLSIYLAGNATSGKDTFFKDLSVILDNKIVCIRHSLADALKIELCVFVKEKLGISVFTENPKEKKIIRPLLVAWGEIRRQQSKGTYWTSLLTEPIKNTLSQGCLSITTDIRYCTEYSGFPYDELYWAKEQMKGKLVFITRHDNGLEIPPPNEQEAKNNVYIKKAADFQLVWPTTLDSEIRQDYIKTQLKPLLELIEKEIH